MPTTILATKLYIPPPRPKVIHRPRLMERLKAGLQSKLILISAPAGFGKTALASEWISSCKRPTAWLSLDECDNDPIRFLTYFVAALQTIVPKIGASVLTELQSPQHPPIKSMLTTLLNEIDTITDNINIVLDDYHLIETKSVDDILSFLFEHLQPQLQIVITTREDPGLPLARLRARGQMTELRANDLRFTSDEAAEFLTQSMGLTLSTENIIALETRTEGWIVGLQLAALSMQEHDDTQSFIDSFTGSHHFVLDYLLEEVLQQQPQNIQNFLLYTSILEHLCGALCDAVLLNTTASGRETLETIEQANLFVIPLDHHREWYRYHHLFADVLQTRLMKEQPDLVPSLHLRACEWYEKRGQRPDAIHHALAAQDYLRAAELIEFAWTDVDRYSQSAPWLNWAKSLPQELFRTRPVLMVNYAWALLFIGQLEECEARLQEIETLLDLTTNPGEMPEVPVGMVGMVGMVIVDEKQYRNLPLTIASARAFLATSRGDALLAIKHAQQVLALADANDHGVRLKAMAMTAFSYCNIGDLDAAFQSFSDTVASLQNIGLLGESISATFILADIKTIQGRLIDVGVLYENALKLMPNQELPFQGTAYLYLGLSKLYREWGDRDRARQYLQRGIEVNRQSPLQLCHYRIMLTRACEKQDQGDLDGAISDLEQAEQLFYRNVIPEFQSVGALRTRVWIKQGRLDKALAWVHAQKLSVEDEASFPCEFEHITLARYFIAQYRKDSLENTLNQVLGFLERLRDAAITGNRFGSLIEILILQALVQHARYDISDSLESLRQALTLAEPEAYIRIFVDEGKRLELLLSDAATKGIKPDYVKKLLEAFEKDRQRLKENTPSSQEFSPHGATISTTSTTSLNDTLIAPLSRRELEILRLIAQGLSNQEISERLFIALRTVKGHNQKIFAKLQVQRRTEAVARARELALV